MEYLLYLGTGFLASAIGAIPPGAVNLSVVYTSLNKGAQFALPIIIAAALGEVILSFLALHCAMFVEENIQKNIYLQYLIALALLLAGIFLLFKGAENDKAQVPRKRDNSFLKGLLLAVLNPPVLVFWLVAFAYLAANSGLVLEMGLFQLVLLFFVGVFLGKIFTLFLYLQLSKRIAKRVQNVSSFLNKSIGLLILIIASFQLGQLLFYAS